MTTIIDACEIQIDGLVPILRRQLLNRTKYTRAGVVDQDIEPAESGSHRAEKSLYLVQFRHIGRLAKHISARIPLQFIGGPRHGIRRAAAEGHSGSRSQTR